MTDKTLTWALRAIEGERKRADEQRGRYMATIRKPDDYASRLTRYRTIRMYALEDALAILREIDA